MRYLNPANIVLTSIMTLAGFFAFVLHWKKYQTNKSIILYVTLLTASFLLSSYAVSRTERLVHVPIFMIANIGIALILLKSRINSKPLEFIFYSLSAYFTLLFIRGLDPNSAIASVSRNGISELMIFLCCVLYTIQVKELKEVSILPAFVTLLICTWAVGRSGIISSLTLLSLLFLFKRKSSTTSFGIAFGIFFGFCIVYLLIPHFLLDIGSLLDFFRPAIEHSSLRVSQGFDPRFSIWADYINALGLYNIIFGENNFYYLEAVNDWRLKNYHNIFISLHAQTGAFAFIVIAVTGLALRHFYRFNKTYFVLFLVLILRGLTDDYMFFESRDFIYYYFLFLYLNRNEKIPYVPASAQAATPHKDAPPAP